MEKVMTDIEKLANRQTADHDMIVKIASCVQNMSETLDDVKKSVELVKTMCSNRLPHCMGLFATEKRLAEEKIEIQKKFESRDGLAKWAVGLAVCNSIALIGVIIALVNLIQHAK